MDISQCKVFVPNPIHHDALTFLKERTTTVLWDDPVMETWHEEADAIIVRTFRINGDDIARCRKLKVIGKHGIGVDTIDVDAAKKAGIQVVYTPLANAESVAELAVTFMLAMSRNLCAGFQSMREGKKLPAPALVGVEMLGKTVGVIGMGRIGRRVASILRAAFGVEVLAFDPFLPDAAWSALPFPVRKCQSVDELVAVSDYVTVHVPLTSETRNCIGPRQFACCKPGGMLVNTARGGVVDEAALADALRSGRLRFAASDVFVEEPPPPDHPLLALDNFMAMPHVAGNTQEALYRMGTTVAADIVKVLNHEKPEFHVP